MEAPLEPVSIGNSHARTVALGDLNVSEFRFPAGLRLAPHEHEYATVAVTLEGQVDTLLSGSRRVQVPVNTVLAKPPGEVHGNAVDGRDARVIILQAPPGASQDELRCCARILREVHHARDDHAGSLAWTMARELAAPDEVTPLALEGLARELLATIARLAAHRRESPLPRWLRRAQDLIRDRYAEALTLSELAREAGVHPVYLARAFRAHAGCSVGAFLRRLRVERAAERLAGSDAPIADIAQEVGFCDQSHLARVFRRRTGLTPSGYRAQHRG